YITTAVIIGFILLSAMGPPVVAYLAKQFSAITDFIMNLSIPILYTGSAVLIMLIYLLSWGLSTAIYQRKVF
ncbi:ABC-2 transporter permease, partial [Streptococcus pneumoniae]|nr:ABC-2 transporter permease [Streptococcus pneumoniae]